jgi:pimeloyl-ACP methyl ester carboxylesterase
MWTPVISALKSRFRVLAPDLIGYGRSDPWPAELAFGLDDELRLIEPLIEHAPAHVVAHSYGAVIALQLARARRIALRSLTLIEPVEFRVLRVAGDDAGWAQMDGFSKRFLARMAAGETEAALREFVEFWSGIGAWERMEETARAQMRRAAAKIVLDFRATLAEPISDLWSGIDVPVRLLSGDMSPLPVRRIAALLAKQLPDATLRIVAGADHFLPMTHHELLAQWLLQDLDP